MNRVEVVRGGALSPEEVAAVVLALTAPPPPPPRPTSAEPSMAAWRRAGLFETTGGGVIGSPADLRRRQRLPAS